MNPTFDNDLGTKPPSGSPPKMNRAQRRELAARMRAAVPRRYRKYRRYADGVVRMGPFAVAKAKRRAITRFYQALKAALAGEGSDAAK